MNLAEPGSPWLRLFSLIALVALAPGAEGCEPTSSGPASCSVGGVDYDDGASGVPAPDGCNSCVCSDGALTACTQLVCPGEVDGGLLDAATEDGGVGDSGAHDGGPPDAGLMPPEPMRPLTNADGANDALRGVGRLRALRTCTAFVIHTPGPAEGPAFALTAGHCALDSSQPNATRPRVDAPADWPLVLNAFADTGSERIEVRAQRLVYATLHQRDVAVLRLNVSKAQLAELDVVPLELAAAIPDAGLRVQIVGIPTDEDSLLAGRCNALGRRNIGEWYWYWEDELADDCLGLRRGFSGSPVLDAQGRVAGVVGTTTRGAISETCYLGNPCEINGAGNQLASETNYATAAAGLSGCFDAAGAFTLADPCPLEPADRIHLTGFTPTPQQPDQPHWLATLPNGWAQVRFKTGPAHLTDCRDEVGYSAPRAATVDALAEVPVGPAEGAHVLCVLGAREEEAGALTWQPLAHPTRVLTYVDRTPPELTPVVSERAVGEILWVEPLFAVPELSAYEYAFTSVEDECPAAGDDAYAIYIRIPIPVDLSRESRRRFCLIGDDHAGNRSRVHSYLLPQE